MSKMTEERLLQWIDNPGSVVDFHGAWELVNEEAKPRMTGLIIDCVNTHTRESWVKGLLTGLAIGIVATALYNCNNPPLQRWVDPHIPFNKLDKYEQKARRALLDDILGAGTGK